MQNFFTTTILWAIFALTAVGQYSTVAPASFSRKSLDPGKSGEELVSAVYKEFNGKELGINYGLFRNALIGYYNLKQQAKVKRPVLTIIDFGLPSIEKRMWILDLKNKKVLEHTFVAHGKNSGENYAVNFSNVPNSYMSSLGFYLTESTYFGKHGLSLRLQGLDLGFNSNAASRAIVLHGAEYVSENFIKCNGRLGRSHGCPAVPVEKTDSIIEMVKNGSVLFISNQKKKYKSGFLEEKNAYELLSRESISCKSKITK